MIQHVEISKTELRKRIIAQEISFGGNKQLKIYGTLHCTSGKRMKKENRVFFHTEKQAIDDGYRPCGHCMSLQYKTWQKMHLFDRDADEKLNLLPKDGTVNYYGKVLTQQEAAHYLDLLMKTIAWKNDEANMFGKHIVTKRKAAWYGDNKHCPGRRSC